MFKKTFAALAMSSMFAGLTSKMSSLATSVAAVSKDFRGAGIFQGRISRTRNVNMKNVHKQKWDLVSSNGDGTGQFVNRTTHAYETKRIANPKSTKQNPVRELSEYAQQHFGLLVA